MTVTLETKDGELNGLQHAVNEAREGSETVRVSKSALRHLLLDHAAMNGALRRQGQPATPPE